MIHYQALTYYGQVSEDGNFFSSNKDFKVRTTKRVTCTTCRSTRQPATTGLLDV